MIDLHEHVRRSQHTRFFKSGLTPDPNWSQHLPLNTPQINLQ